MCEGLLAEADSIRAEDERCCEAIGLAGQVDWVMTGADGIAGNGDTANKVGTYGLAVLARSHGIPFYVVAPTSIFDLTLADGSAIPIEQRPAPVEVRCHNGAFDVKLAELISGIVTDRGVVAPVGRESIGRIFSRSLLHGGN